MSLFILRRILTLAATLIGASVIIFLVLDALPGNAAQVLMGADASHAWLAVWCPGLGWVDLDPTNNLVPSDRHVTVSWGRDYSDCSPVRESATTALTPGPDGTLARIYGISLAGLPPGDYELGLAVRDEIGVKVAELREPFTVQRAVGVTAAPR